MGAVDGKHLELLPGDAPNPAGNLRSLSVTQALDRTDEVDQRRLTGGKVVERSDGNPGTRIVIFLERRAKQIADYRDGEGQADRAIQGDRYFEQELAACVRRCLPLRR